MQGGGHGRRTAATEAATAATPPPPKIPDGEERRTTRAEGRSAREKGRKNSVAREQPADRFCSDERVMDIKWVHGTHRQINSISNTGPAAFREQRFNKYATARPTRTIRNIKRSFVSLSLFPPFSPFSLFPLCVPVCVALARRSTPLCSKLRRQIFGEKPIVLEDACYNLPLSFAAFPLASSFFLFSRSKFENKKKGIDRRRGSENRSAAKLFSHRIDFETGKIS